MSDFEVHLSELDTAARKDMRALAWTYATLASDARSTDVDAANMAADPPVCPEGGEFAKGWTDLRNEIVRVLDACSGNAVQIGRALEHVVDTYAATDAHAQAVLKDLSDSLNHTS